MKRPKKVNKLERAQQKKKLMEYYQSGTGLFIFRNKSSVASLELPKVSKDGKKWIQPNETWEGDSYFFSMIPQDAILVKTLEEQQNISLEQINTITKEEKMQERLILDQPDQVTKNGKVEHKVTEGNLPINEVSPQDNDSNEKEKLLTEDPLAGVTIIRD